MTYGKSLLTDSVVKQITSKVDASLAKPIDVGIVISLAFIVLNKKMGKRLKRPDDTEFYQ
ncbi:hypothetical protein [Lentilactobacillus senioris]|uniref:hypothetical protein n=1 Tax=Lentilactobacillus senioris TaxID=931534 RepID=UPI003D287057